MDSINGKKIAIIATDGFEQSELIEPLEALKKSGAVCHVIAPKPGSIKGWKDKEWGQEVKVDKTLDEASVDDYDGLLIPGGVINTDHLRLEDAAIDLVEDFMGEGKPIAAICHGPQLLIEADVLDGRRVTSYKAIRRDLENAGAEWIDADVVVDNGLVTSRTPKDLPSFIKKMIEEFSEGVHEQDYL